MSEYDEYDDLSELNSIDGDEESEQGGNDSDYNGSESAESESEPAESESESDDDEIFCASDLSEPEDVNSEEEDDEDENEDDDRNKVREELFKEIKRLNETYEYLTVNHIRDLSRAFHNLEGEKIRDFAKERYTNLYTREVRHKVFCLIQDRLKEEHDIRRGQGGCSSVFQYSGWLSSIFSLVLCAKCEVPEAQDPVVEAVMMNTARADVSELIADSLFKKAKEPKAGGGQDDLILSRRAVGAAAEVLRILQETRPDIQVNCDARKKRNPEAKRARSDTIIYGCSIRAVPTEQEKKVCLTYTPVDGSECHIHACVPKATRLGDLLATMEQEYPDVVARFGNFGNSQRIVYIQEPYSSDPSVDLNKNRAIQIDNDAKVDELHKNILKLIILKNEHQEIYRPSLKISMNNEVVVNEVLEDIGKNTTVLQAWDGILEKMDDLLYSQLNYGRNQQFKFTYVPSQSDKLGSEQTCRFNMYKKLAQLRDRFKVDFFNPYVRMLRNLYIPSNLNLKPITIKIEEA